MFVDRFITNKGIFNRINGLYARLLMLNKQADGKTRCQKKLSTSGPRHNPSIPNAQRARVALGFEVDAGLLQDPLFDALVVVAQ